MLRCFNSGHVKKHQLSLGAPVLELAIQSAEEIAEHEEETAITMDVGDTTVCGGVVNCMLNIPHPQHKIVIISHCSSSFNRLCSSLVVIVPLCPS